MEDEISEWLKRVRQLLKTMRGSPLALALLKSISEKLFDSEVARRKNAKRKTRGGPPKVWESCPYCGEEFGARDLRDHKPKCPKRK